MASDLRRLRALRAKSTRCWRRRAMRSRRASRACSVAATRMPHRQRVMPHPAARSEQLMLRGRRSGSRAHAPGFFGRRGFRVSTRAAAFFWPGCVTVSLPLRCARLLCAVLQQMWARACESHVRMCRAPACVPWCVSREGGSVERRVLWLWCNPCERRYQAPCVHVCLCVHASLTPSLLGRPSVIGSCEARPCQARVARTLSCY